MRADTNFIVKLIKLTKKPYPNFAAYCNYLNIGIRKEAFKHLEIFLKLTENWDLADKISFCKDVFSLLPATNDSRIILTTYLNEKLLKPTLLALTEYEPNNYKVFLWYGFHYDDIIFLKRAYVLNNYSKTIKLVLLERLEYNLWLSTHHLPDAYLGDLARDKEDLSLAFEIIDDSNEIELSNLKERFSDYENQINIFIGL